MKSFFYLYLLLFCSIMLSVIETYSQVPQVFKYQAIVRNSIGIVVANQSVNLRTSLLQNSATGTQVYSEEHAITTNTFGLVNIEIGNGSNAIGTFASINWSTGIYFIKIELDITGGSTFSDMGTTQLLSVPYALFAASGNPGPQGQQGNQGIQGPQGNTGTDGKTILNGTSNPTTQGVDGDFYINTSTATLFGPKTGGIWGAGTSLIGPAGTYTSGTGINITGSVISNTAPDQTIIVNNGTGISITGTYPDFTITNTSPNQSVSLIGTGATTITGSYPNFTISSFDNNTTYTNGTGLSLNGTTFSANFGTTSTTVAQGDHAHASYGVGGTNGQVQFNNNGLFEGNTNLFWDNANNRLGIGISTPTTMLHVNGTLRITDDTEGSGKIFTSDATGVGSWQNPVTPAIGSSTGTANYIPKFIAANSLGNSEMYQNGTHIGVGTTTPTGKFQIQQDTSALDTEPIFEIKDKTGQTVMVIYKDSAHFFVKDPGGAKTANRGSFAVSGKSDSKSFTNNYLFINPDSTRIYTSDSIAGFGTKNILGTQKTGYMQLTPKNYFIGHQAGNALSSNINNTGRFNSFIGYQAGYNNSGGYKNYFIGYKAGYSNTSGYSDIFIGDSAGFNNQSGEKNVFIGNQAGVNNTWGRVNVFIGSSAGFSNISGSSCTAIGESALYSSSTGQGITAVGNNALYSNTTGWSNCGFGEGALRANTTGAANVAVGRWALYNNTTGQNNTAVGNIAFWNGNYTNSTAIGFSSTINANNQVKLGDLNITSFYCIGAYVGAVGVTNRDLYVDNAGKIGFLSSSARYKNNISDMENINWIYGLRPVNYTYKNDETNKKQYGLIAEEVEKINPLFISYNPDGTIETVNYSSFISPMLKAIQVQKNKLDDQQKMIEELYKRIDVLEKIILSK